MATDALILLLLATGLRLDDVAKMGCNLQPLPDGIRIPFLHPRKCDISKRPLLPHQEVRHFAVDRISPVSAIRRYMDMATFRKPEADALFISSLGTNAASPTLGGWIKKLFEKANIKATPGSCRSAATSAAYLKNIPIHEILEYAGWRSECTFRAFYNRPVLKALSFLPDPE